MPKDYFLYLLRVMQANCELEILRTPSGEERNKLCDLNMKLLDLIMDYE